MISLLVNLKNVRFIAESRMMVAKDWKWRDWGAVGETNKQKRGK